jgi:hypothetical protein
MNKRACAEMVAEMVGLEYGYVLEAATYFSTLDEAFEWIYLSEDNFEYSQLDVIKQLSNVTIEEMKELNANTPAEYMVLNHDHTYLTTEGVAYIRITR